MCSKILVTGATGFIGSHLVELFVNKGYSVVAFDRYNPNNNWGWLENSPVKNDVDVVLGDIRDYDSVYKAMSSCDAVFHLAALIGIPYSYISPLAYIRTNVEGTYNVLEASKNLDVNQVIVTSTSEIYGSAQYVPIDEKHPVVGQSPYSATKIGADQLALSYFRSFDIPVKIVRPFNTYGPRQSARAIIPTIISQIFAGKKELSLGNLGPTRDLTYVKDTCAGFLDIYKCNELYGTATNIGMNQENSIGNLVDKIAGIIGANITISTDANRTRPDNSEVTRLMCDNTKLLKNTTWKPRYTLEKGLRETIDWIKSNDDYIKPEHYSI